MEVVISDASSLILLQKTLLLEDLVAHLKIFISPEVYQEAVEKGKERKFPDAYHLERKIQQKAIEIKEVKDHKLVQQLMDDFGVGKGETESVVLSLEQGKRTIVTDDHKAIRLCKVYEIPFVTALTLVVAAQRNKVISNEKAREMVRKLELYGRYKDRLIIEALQILGGKND